MKSQFTAYDLMRPLRSAAKHFELDIEKDCQKNWIDFRELPAHGSLAVYDFEDGVQMIVLNGRLPEAWEISFNSKKESPFLMIFNVRGHMSFNYGGVDEDIQIEPLKTLLIAHPPGQSQSIKIKGQEEAVFIMLHLDRNLYIHHLHCLPENVRAEALAIFSGKTALKMFQNSSYGMSGAAIVQQITSDGEKGLIHSTFAEAKALELFSLQLRRWEEEISGSNGNKKALHPSDIEKIILARNMLIEDVQNAPTIEVLSKKAGINRQKLKQGFKLVFGKTINEYLRNERLKLARQILTHDNLTIKEVSVRVGYENASYFARRFKKAYGLYPNEYINAALALQEEE